MSPPPSDRFLRACALGGCALGGLLPAAAADAPETAASLRDSRPNVLFILIDDLGWTDAGCLGSKYFETPNIDKLRAQGMLFTDAYSTAPVSSPARAALMTGRYQTRYDLTDVFMTGAKERYTKLIAVPPNPNLAPSEITLGELFRQNGYATACIGKWHIGEAKGSRPQDHGFDFVVPETKQHVDGDYRALNFYNENTIAFITRNKDRPWYVHLGETVVHIPFEAPQTLIDKYAAKVTPGDPQCFPIYAATIEMLDDKIGELMQTLEKLGLADKTLVVLTSDNGGRASNFDWQMVTSNEPLRGGKHTLWEGGLRVPLIMRWPGKIAPDSTCATPTTALDYFPTFARLIGADIAAYKRPYDGESILPLLAGGALPPRTLCWYYPHYNHGPTFGQSTVIYKTRPCAAVRDGDYKLVEWLEEPRAVELYNIRLDPSEKTNLAATQPEKVKALREKLQAWCLVVEVKPLEVRKPYNGALFGIPLEDIEAFRMEGENRLRLQLGLPKVEAKGVAPDDSAAMVGLGKSKDEAPPPAAPKAMTD